MTRRRPRRAFSADAGFAFLGEAAGKGEEGEEEEEGEEAPSGAGKGGAEADEDEEEEEGGGDGKGPCRGLMREPVFTALSLPLPEGLDTEPELLPLPLGAPGAPGGEEPSSESCRNGKIRVCVWEERGG